MRYVLIGVGLLIALGVGYVFAWPVPIEPVEVTVGQNPGFVGPYAPNEALRSVRWLGDTLGQGPEDVTVKDGFAYSGLQDGRVVRVKTDTQTSIGPMPAPVPPLPGGSAPAPVTGGDTLANTNGRPLGIRADPFRNIVVADAKRGLLAVTPTGQVIEVAKIYQGRPLRFVDGVDIAKDGTIYFSDATTRHGFDDFQLDFFEGQTTGRLFSFDPRSGQLQQRMDGLAFANGVALGPDEEYVLVNETAAHRIKRLWLKGAKQGTQDTFAENLPGYPDNISFNGRDLFWVALVGPRIRALEESYKSVSGRKLTYRLSKIGLATLPVIPDPYGCIVAFDTQGQVVATLQDPGGRTISGITGVVEKDGVLYLGGLTQDRIATIPVPPQLLNRAPPPPPPSPE